MSVLLACIETLSKGYVFWGQGQSSVAGQPNQDGSQVVAAVEEVLDLAEVALPVLPKGEGVVGA
jgi:hypothetical protein